MHKLVYLGNNQYQCVDCGHGADKAGVEAFQKTDCEAKSDFVTMNKKIARLEQELKEVLEISRVNDERLTIVENTALAHPAEVTPSGT